MGQRIAAAFLVIAFATGALLWTLPRAFINPVSAICERVLARIALEKSDLEELRSDCAQGAALVTPGTPRERVVEVLRFVFSRRDISHLDLYHPREVERLWTGRVLETGIESEFIDGELVVTDVAERSPASEAGVRFGDVIASIQGRHPAPGVASSVGGAYEIRRLEGAKIVELEPREIAWDGRPRLIRHSADQAVVRLKSFRASSFEGEHWRALVRELSGYKKIILDLRGNPGGNFVAGLRFLSPFMCGEQTIGFLLKPRLELSRPERLPDDLADENQLAIIDGHGLVELKSFDDYGCLTARVGVLIDSRTASTAEMVAQALHDYLDAPLYGVSSAGQLLVGVWYDVPELGPGWRVSIPEAVYQSRRGKRIEGHGVRVERQIYYDLADFQRGKDTWIEALFADLRRERVRRDSASVVSE